MDSLPTPGRLRTFLAVVAAGSVRAAAADLHVTEPAVSAALTQLSHQLGAELFVRDGRGLRITAAGEVYADYARSVLGMLTEAGQAVQSVEHGRLRIGAVATASEVVLPEALGTFGHTHPDLMLEVTVAPRDELFDLLRHREVDVALGGRPPRGSGFALRAVRDNTLILVAAPGVAAGADLATTQWLLRGVGSGLRQTTLGVFEQLGINPPTLTLGTHGAVVASARAGLGITLVHSDAVASDLSRGDLAEVSSTVTPMNRPWIVATNERTAPQARLFVQHLISSGMGDRAFHPAVRPRG